MDANKIMSKSSIPRTEEENDGLISLIVGGGGGGAPRSFPNKKKQETKQDQQRGKANEKERMGGGRPHLRKESQGEKT